MGTSKSEVQHTARCGAAAGQAGRLPGRRAPRVHAVRAVTAFSAWTRANARQPPGPWQAPIPATITGGAASLLQCLWRPAARLTTHCNAGPWLSKQRMRHALLHPPPTVSCPAPVLLACGTRRHFTRSSHAWVWLVQSPLAKSLQFIRKVFIRQQLKREAGAPVLRNPLHIGLRFRVYHVVIVSGHDQARE